MKFSTSLIVIAISLGLYFMYIGPSMADISALSAKKTEYDNVLQKSKELANKRDSVLAVYNGISADDLARLDKVIPETFDAVMFANDISGLTSKYGLSLKELKVNSPQAEVRSEIVTQSATQPYKVSSVNFSVTGSYTQFVSFLQDLESSLRLSDVANLSVKTSQKSANTLEYSLDVLTYSLH